MSAPEEPIRDDPSPGNIGFNVRKRSTFFAEAQSHLLSDRPSNEML